MGATAYITQELHSGKKIILNLQNTTQKYISSVYVLYDLMISSVCVHFRINYPKSSLWGGMKLW